MAEEHQDEFVTVHGLRFNVKDENSKTVKDLLHKWEHHSDHDKLHELLHDARHSPDGKQHFEDEGVTAVHHSDGHYTLQKREHH